jgi:RNA polymerase sigma factor (sigma-70 family)
LAGLCDRAASSYEPDVVALMSAQPSTPPSEAAEMEHAYREHRDPVLAMLRADFHGLADAEDVYHEAWAELLELHARGEKARNVRALLKTIAWRRARDRLRKMSPDALDPMSAAFERIADSDPQPDEQATVRLEAAALRQIIDDLEPRQAAVLKLRFDWHLDAHEIQRCLGVSPKRLEKIVTEAYKSLAERLGDEASHTAWRRRQRSLLLACEAGIASERQRRRAMQMVAQDPGCRAMLREMRANLHDLAALTPMPVLVEFDETHAQHVIGGLGRIQDLLSQPRRLSLDLLTRAPDAPSIADRLAWGRAALGGGAAAKFVSFCLAAGGTVTACVEGVRLLHHEHASHHHARVVARRPKPAPHAVPVRLPDPPSGVKPTTSSGSGTTSSGPAPSSPKSRPPASPAPSGSTEFSPGAVGSTSPPAAAAAAPSGGGGEFAP